MLNGAIGVLKVAEILSCSEYTVYRKLKSGDIEHLGDGKMGGAWWFDEDYIYRLRDSGEFFGKPGRPPKKAVTE